MIKQEKEVAMMIRLKHIIGMAVALPAVCLLFLTQSFATPLPARANVPDPNNPNQTIEITLPGAPRWANNTTINVFINQDPQQNGTRHEEFRTGIQRWQNELASRGITLNIQIGTPPQGTQNVVEVRWVQPGTLGGNDGFGQYIANVITEQRTDPNGGTVMTQRANGIRSGLIQIETDTVDGTFLRNLAMHEFAHVLGLNDEATAQTQPHNATDHIVLADADQGFSPRDIAELNAIYGTPIPQGQQRPQSNIQGTGQGGGGGYRYEYTVTWEGGPEIPMFQIDIPIFQDIFDLSTPDGWYLDGYSVDARSNLEGQLLLSKTALTFTTLDSLLGPSNLSATFAFSTFSPPEYVLSYAMGDNFPLLVGPSAIPEHSTMLLLGSGLIGLAGYGRKKFFKK
jgi:hypothetical protein